MEINKKNVLNGIKTGFIYLFNILIYLFIPLLLWVYFGYKYGLFGMLAVIIIVLILRGWTIRHLFIIKLREMETIIWGKPLDRKEWDKGEFKRVKPQMVRGTKRRNKRE